MFKTIKVYLFDTRDLSVELLDFDMFQKCRNDLEKGQYVIYHNIKNSTIDCIGVKDTDEIKSFWFHIFDNKIYPVAKVSYEDSMKFFMEVSLGIVEECVYRDYNYSITNNHISGKKKHILIKDEPFWDVRLKTYLQKDFAQETYEWCGYA